jgi:hypothetical protein
MIYDSSTSCKAVQEQIPAVQFVDYWKGLMPFNDSFSAQLHKMSDSCGYTDYLSTYFTLPPPGPFPTQLPGTDEDENTFDNCHVFDAIYNEVFYINPCSELCTSLYTRLCSANSLDRWLRLALYFGMSSAFLGPLATFLKALVYTSTEPTFKKPSALRLGTGTNEQTSMCLSTVPTTVLRRVYAFCQESSREARGL